MAYNFQHNKSPQPFGGRGKQSDGAASSRNIGVPAAPASPFRPASSSPLPMAPRMSAPMDFHAASPGPMMLRRQLLSPPCGSSASPQSSPCPSPVAGARLRPHSIALTSAEGGGGSPQQQLQHFLGTCNSYKLLACFFSVIDDVGGFLHSINVLTRFSARGHRNLPSRCRFIFIDVDVYLRRTAIKAHRGYAQHYVVQ